MALFSSTINACTAKMPRMPYSPQNSAAQSNIGHPECFTWSEELPDTLSVSAGRSPPRHFRVPRNAPIGCQTPAVTLPTPAARLDSRFMRQTQLSFVSSQTAFLLLKTQKGCGKSSLGIRKWAMQPSVFVALTAWNPIEGPTVHRGTIFTSSLPNVTAYLRRIVFLVPWNYPLPRPKLWNLQRGQGLACFVSRYPERRVRSAHRFFWQIGTHYLQGVNGLAPELTGPSGLARGF